MVGQEAHGIPGPAPLTAVEEWEAALAVKQKRSLRPRLASEARRLEVVPMVKQRRGLRPQGLEARRLPPKRQHLAQV